VRTMKLTLKLITSFVRYRSKSVGILRLQFVVNYLLDGDAVGDWHIFNQPHQQL
jgi:hypothetical protein